MTERVNVMKNKKLIFPIITVIVASMLCIGSVFAWFVIGDEINDMNFQIAKIDSTVTLYSVADTNRNGIPDIDGNGDYLLTEIGTEYAYSDESLASVTYNMSISDILPSQIVTFMLYLQNIGDVTNMVRVGFSDYRNGDTQASAFRSESNLNRLEILSASIGTAISGDTLENEKITFFQNYVSGSGANTAWTNSELVSADDNWTIDGLLTYTGDSNTKKLWLQFCFEPYSELEANISSGASLLSKSAYQNMQNVSMELPMLKIYFEV